MTANISDTRRRVIRLSVYQMDKFIGQPEDEAEQALSNAMYLYAEVRAYVARLRTPSYNLLLAQIIRAYQSTSSKSI